MLVDKRDSEPGQLIGARLGSWEILSLLRESATGTVYVARQVLLDKRVAIKVLSPDLSANTDLALAILRDLASAMQQVGHPGLGSFIDLFGFEDRVFLVASYLEGVSLERYLRDSGPLPWVHAVGIARDIADALAAAHGRGRVHGSLSPANVVIDSGPGRPATERPRAVVDVLDFGEWRFLARLGVRSLERLKSSAPSSHGLSFTAPEQLPLEDVEVEPRSDIYALGCVLHAMLAGAPPFSAQDQGVAAVASMMQPPPRLSELGVDAPAELEALVVAMLAKRPEDRPRRMENVVHAIDRLVWRVELAAKPVVPLSVGPDPARPPRLDDNVQFTVFRPRAVVPAEWYPLLAFAHLSERRPDGPADAPDPVQELARQAQEVLGARWQDYRQTAQEATRAIPESGDLTFVPESEQLSFDPPRVTVRWTEPVHRADFRLRAEASSAGATARGHITVFLGSIIVADVPFGVRVEAVAAPAELEPAASARAYRRIFASYAHADGFLVRQFEELAHALGDRYISDWLELRAGETWAPRLQELISQADVFQLFWSSRSMRSDYVRQEWEYALSLRRPHFVRPTYWEDPLPMSEAEGLPPPALKALHFARIAVAPPGVATVIAGRSSVPVAASPSRTTLAVATLSASAGDAEWEAPNRPAPSRRAWRWLATVPVAALAFVAVGVLTMRGGSLPQQPPIVAGNPPPHVLAPPPAEATVTFSDAPPSLTVTVDGVPVEPPIRLQPGRSARIEARAPGYEPLVLELDAVAGTDRVVSLRRMAVATPTNPKRPRRDGHAARPRIQDNASEVSKPFSERHEWAH